MRGAGQAAPLRAREQRCSGGAAAGIDIGTGASAIYALLGAAMCGWRMLGTDCSEEALRGAESNVAANPHLAPLLELRDTRRGGREGAEAAILSGVIGARTPPRACGTPPRSRRLADAQHARRQAAKRRTR